MRTTELLSLEQLIETKQKTIGKGDARLIKSESPQTLAFKAIEALDRATFRAIREGREDIFIPFTSVACNIGRSMLAKIENPEDSIQRKNTKRFRTGAWMLDRLADIKLIELNEGRSKRQEHTISICDWELFTKLVLAIPANLENDPVDTRPQISAPEPFKNFYHTSGPEMVRKCSKRAKKAFKMDAMPQAYGAINKQMATGYKINTKLLEIYNTLGVEAASNLAGKNLDDIQKESIEYSARMTMQLANDISDREFWSMMYYDFRGRLYQSTSYLNYGGSKLAKSLFMLSDEKPLGEDGLKWIKIHIANCFGEDKLPLAEREAFTDAHLDELLAIAEDPANNLDALAAVDDPYGLLGAVLELKRYLESDDKLSFTTGLPIALDMTCSGLQILSLLSRDEQSASLCNLLGDSIRGDYYLYIADNIRLFKEDPYWFKHADKRRKLVKRSAMTYFYSCGAKTMGTHIWNDFKSEKGFEALSKQNCEKLGKEIYKACRELMEGPTKLMDRFIELGLQKYKEGDHFCIQMPTGFVFDQNYCLNETKQVQVIFRGNELKCKVVVKKAAKVDGRKVETASSPNVVHAFDAALLSRIITEGDYANAVIHDSFASVPGDAEQLFNDTRKVAVDIFSEDQLKNVLGIDDLQDGKLNVNGVMENEYFCS